jgi:hypothetical protein
MLFLKLVQACGLNRNRLELSRIFRCCLIFSPVQNVVVQSARLNRPLRFFTTRWSVQSSTIEPKCLAGFHIIAWVHAQAYHVKRLVQSARLNQPLCFFTTPFTPFIKGDLSEFPLTKGVKGVVSLC